MNSAARLNEPVRSVEELARSPGNVGRRAYGDAVGLVLRLVVADVVDDDLELECVLSGVDNTTGSGDYRVVMDPMLYPTAHEGFTYDYDPSNGNGVNRRRAVSAGQSVDELQYMTPPYAVGDLVLGLQFPTELVLLAQGRHWTADAEASAQVQALGAAEPGTFPEGIETILDDWPTVTLDTGGDFDPVSGVFTAPRNGWYTIRFDLPVSTVGIATNESVNLRARFFLDGTTVIGGDWLPLTSNFEDGVLKFTRRIYLSASQTVDVRLTLFSTRGFDLDFTDGFTALDFSENRELAGVVPP